MSVQYGLRKVTEEDRELLFEWANDSECRKNSLNSAEIPYEEHCRWFKEKLNNRSCNMYIYLYQDREAGQIRIDCQGENGQISYSVAKEYRGHGHGNRILQLIEREMAGKIKYLTAVVKTQNTASRLKFEQNGYEKEIEGDFIYYKKKLNEK